MYPLSVEDERETKTEQRSVKNEFAYCMHVCQADVYTTYLRTKATMYGYYSPLG